MSKDISKYRDEVMTHLKYIKEKVDANYSHLNKLNNRERYILYNRFGLGNKKTQTLDQIGIRFGVSRERIRQVETMALRKLRRMITREYKIELDSFDRGGHLITHF